MAKTAFPGALQTGAKIGKYEVREQVAAGGMAIIYKGHDPSLDRMVAIKQIAPHLAQDARFLERFRAEAQTLARLSSSQANIVSVYELIEQDSQLFLVMEYVEGTTLRAMMDRGPISLQTGLGVLLSTALGLRAMHAQSIVHRDLSPANIMIGQDGALKITDFGLIGHSGGKTSLPMGTTKYMAPEMFTGGTVDPRADLYSLGLIAYEMFAGREKFDATFRDVLRDEKAQQVRWMHWHSNSALLAPPLKDLQPGIPPLISKIVERMMEKDPSRRFASADQIIRWLRRIFVMHVQGKSVSVDESENLEKEMEADTVAAGGVPAVRGGAAAAREAGASLATVEKTAPIPVPKWTWQRAAFWAATLCGPLLILASVLLIWKYHTGNMERNARLDRLAAARLLFEDNKFQGAAKAYAAIAVDYQNNPSVATPALQFKWLALAEAALQADDLPAAKGHIAKAETLNIAGHWATDFRKRLNDKEGIKQGLADVEQFVKGGQFDEAIMLLSSLQKTFNVDYGSRIEEITSRKTLRDYTALLKKADEYAKQGRFGEAETLYRRAEEIQSTPEVVERLATLGKRVAYAAHLARAEKAAAGNQWPEAAKEYEEAVKLQPSPQLEAKLKSAKIQALLARAAALEKSGLNDKAMAVYAEILGLDPQQPVANAKAELAGARKKRDGFIKAGDEAMAKGAFKEAITSYQSAQPLIDPTETALKAKVATQLKEAQYQDAMTTGRAAEERGDWDAARTAYLAAQGINDTAEVKDALANLEITREYTQHILIGKELLAQFRYVQALKEFELAKEVRDTEQVRELIRETNFQRYLTQAKGLIPDKRLPEAIGVLRVARTYADETQKIEIDALIMMCENALKTESE
jgi:tetratricopeptide (TPR) repeat protein